MNALELGIAGNNKKWRYNHIFINVLNASEEVTVEFLASVVRKLARRYANKINNLGVAELEIAIPVSAKGEVTNYRFVCTTPTREVLSVDLYKTVQESDGSSRFEFVTDLSFGNTGAYHALHGKPTHEPYPTISPLRRQRERAWAADTLYVYDFPDIMKKAIAKIWFRHIAEEQGAGTQVTLPEHYFTATELVVDNSTSPPSLKEVHRDAGENDIGMVAWVIRFKTVEYPEGREIVVISNDISHSVGTFGVKESTLFDLASKYARVRTIPRIYFSANSGARIGLAEELRSKFQIAWVNNDLSKGMDYIYISEADNKELGESVITERTEVEGEVRYVIKGIVGQGESMGVENLSQSGLIAGETALSYAQNYTLTIVTGRSVGIGAYLARLGQRVIQKKAVAAPILLTGYGALNKLLGRRVYRSNAQLGGIDIMYNNGVTHLVCDNDLHGVIQMLTLLSYVPARRHLPPPIWPSQSDPVNRAISYEPANAELYDVRWLLTGKTEDNKHLSGFFDKGSFTEVLGGWAKSIVAGRARLGGIPMGVIAVEPRITNLIKPADPANPASKEEIKPRPPLVWFPDSSYKTAQVINDLQAEDIPLIIFANWRGFSGGMTDMFDEILKFGSMIVDRLREFEQPVFVYLPPFATLRGGAWVVVDSQVNKSIIEMYAAPEARGGVLEAEGTAEIKFKKANLTKSMHRLDDKLKTLVAQRDALAADGKSTAAVDAEIASRQESLLPYYHTVGTHFCDLHDTPGRMKAKGVIREIVPWAQSRTYFYWRLRRRLAEDGLARAIETAVKDPLATSAAADRDVVFAQAYNYIHQWQAEDLKLAPGVDATDEAAVQWHATNQASFGARIEALRVSNIRALAVDDNFLAQLTTLVADLDQDQRANLIKAVQRRLA